MTRRWFQRLFFVNKLIHLILYICVDFLLKLSYRIMSSNPLGPEWNISVEGLELLTENGNIKDKSKIYQNALSTDLKDVGKLALGSDLKGTLPKIVLQIQKIRNIAAPKAKENSQAAPRMLKLILTDGVSVIQAIELSTLPSITVEKTPPGSKLLINNAKILSGYLMLEPSNCSLLGGRVPHLVERWEISKNMLNNKRQSDNDGPPRWVNFGKKVLSSHPPPAENFKSMNTENKTKENSEFDAQRNDAITEATSGAVRKVFGGGTKQAVLPPQPRKENHNKRESKFKGKLSRNANRDSDDEMHIKPPKKEPTLFAFLEDKLPITESQSVPENSFRNQSKSDFNNTEPKGKPVNSRKGGQFPIQPNYSNNNQTKPRFEKNDNHFGGGYKSNQKFQQPVKEPAYNSNNNRFNERVGEEMVNGLAHDMVKMKVSSGSNQFASRSLRQHLNLGPNKKFDERPQGNFEKKPFRNDHYNEQVSKTTNSETVELKVGQECLAKYWEDGKYYNAIIQAVTEKTYAVKYKGYGNIEEILKTDCLPVENTRQNAKNTSRKYEENKHHSGTLEFRRGGSYYKSKQ